MRRFLLVGCGGSGGATLQFLMDQLRADLGMRGVHALPKGWQFVHLDVPIAPDGVGPGMPPTVPAQGGRYLGLAHPGANYPGIAQGVESRLRTAGELRQLVAWRPNPAAVGIPITDGAGQQRAIGRMLTIAKAQSIYEELSAAFTILHGHGVTGELSEVADRFSPMTSEQVHSAPVVLVVSSMAGGAGASMVLDVCRLLTLVDGYDPRATALFLFTPEVFGSLPRHARGGVDGNALAMLGELLAAQSGAAAAGDAAVLRAIGLPVPDGDTVPFGRVIPIGARVGASGAPFGDGSAAGVYRGLGRGLAALMLSGQATAEFIGFDLVNPTAVSTDQETVGWGLDVNALLWGSFGFASIGLGRERYAEYAAQRLARAAVDRLVDGHLQPGDSRPATDQLRALNDVKWRSFSQRVGVPVRVDAVRDWFVALLSDAALEPAAARVVEEMIGRRLHLTQPTEFRQWLPVLVRQVAQDSSRMAERVEALAYRWAFDWYCGLMERLEVELTQAIVDSGLAAGQDLLARAGDAVDGWVHTLRGPAGLAVEAHVLPDPTMRKLDGIKGLIDSTHASVQLLREGFTGSTLAAIRARCAGLAADLLQATRNDLLRPLMRACDAALEILVAARKAYPVDTGLARLRTDDYAAWPDGSTEIPRRFFEAHNELLLTSAQDFPAVFDANLAATQPGRPPRDALNAIVEGIIRGRWESAGQLVDSSIVQRLATFRPGVLPTDPRNPSGPPSPPRPGQYRIAVKPDELLERARAWVARPGEPFDVFISQSLRDYLLGGDAGDAELVRRTQDLRQHFLEALALAQPLVAVNPAMVDALHTMSPQTSYKFSDVPFAGLPLARQLHDDLVQMPSVEQTSPGRLEKALRGDSPTTRIDLFGSYGRLSPLTFSSLLAPLDKRWAACVTAGSRGEFWRLRRARRLPGCLPMGEAQRRAIIGGWFVARLAGRLRLPGEHPGPAAEVWDPGREEWVAFPSPLLLDKQDYRTSQDLLVAVLLSSLVAIARSHQYPDLDPLRPYTVLRRFWDDTTSGRSEYDPLVGLAAASTMADWLRTGAGPGTTTAPGRGAAPGPGAAPGQGAGAADQQATASPIDPEERRQKMIRQLGELRQHIGRQYLAAGQAGATGGGDFSALDHPERLNRVPFYHEVAPDVYTVLGQLIDLVSQLRLTGPEGTETLIMDPGLG